MQKYKTSTFLTIITLCVVYLLSSIFKLVGNIVMPIFQDMFHMSSGFTGFTTGAYYITYAPLQLFAAPLCHKWGSEKVIGTSLIVGAVGALLWSLAPSSTAVLVGRLLLGIGVGPCYVGAIYYITKYASLDYAYFAGMLLAAGGFGSVVSSAPISILIEKRGGSEVFLVITIVMVVLASLLFTLSFFNRKNKGVEIPPTPDEAHVFKNFARSFKYMITRPPLLVCALMWALFNSYQLCYQGLWSAKWTAAAFPSFASVRGLTGSICSLGFVLSTIISETLRKKKNKDRVDTVKMSEYLLATFGLLVILSHLIVYIPFLSATVCYVIKCINDFALGYAMGHLCIQVTAYTKEVSRHDMNANVMGIMNGNSSVACLIFQFLTGGIFDLVSSHFNANLSYVTAFAVLEVLLIIGVITAARVEEKYRNVSLD